MAYAAILNTLSSYERQYGATTFAVNGQATVKRHDAIAFDDLFSTGQSAMDASAYVVAPLTFLMANDCEKVEIDGLNLTMTSSEEPKTATLERVWIDDPAAARRPHRPAQDAAAHLSRRRSREDDPDRHPGQCQRHARRHGDRRRAPRPD